MTTLPIDESSRRRREIEALHASPDDDGPPEPEVVDDSEWPDRRRRPGSSYDKYLDGQTWRFVAPSEREARTIRGSLHHRAKALSRPIELRSIRDREHVILYVRTKRERS